ncbi:hypothetical protein D0T51_11025 [Parabacteroides sp. 52]|uniref:hypothetical protein n=1 Tax=unclassified Parabacteroides TaxID=2649774 RepID=UPI0013D49FCF|nr:MULTISPECIES: hypothetical protein [unclassified Parabacteroides]MDH6535679.1 aminoglycoside N3'-acetyltransferase [Parabacteroides sp. PM5-20]NDV56258.1 hypothetical protein [Parabacteroides sp. 52]
MTRQKMTKKETSKSPFNIVKRNLKHLTFDELEEIIAYAMRFRKNKLGEEELRLIKEKEVVEQKLKGLKELDRKENVY